MRTALLWGHYAGNRRDCSSDWFHSPAAVSECVTRGLGFEAARAAAGGGTTAGAAAAAVAAARRGAYLSICVVTVFGQSGS